MSFGIVSHIIQVLEGGYVLLPPQLFSGINGVFKGRMRRKARSLWEQDAPGSNPGTPTAHNRDAENPERVFVSLLFNAKIHTETHYGKEI